MTSPSEPTSFVTTGSSQTGPNRMHAVQCPICESAATGGYRIGDAVLIECPQCGSYRLSGTALVLLREGALPRPDAQRFREIVTRKRGTSNEYPVIGSDDFR